MAFLAALPELAEAAGAAGEAGGAAAGAGEAGAGAGAGEGSPGLFKPKPGAMPGDQNKQENVGASRTLNFQDSANSVRGAVRGGGIN